MAIRVIGVPDQNGIIRVSCGHDMLEIDVSGSIGGGSPPEEAKVDPEFPHVFYAQPRNILDDPYVFGLDAKRGEDPEDAGDIVRRFLAAKADRTVDGPNALLLRNRRSIDVHEIADLARQVRGVAGDVPIGVAFDDLDLP